MFLCKLWLRVRHRESDHLIQQVKLSPMACAREAKWKTQAPLEYELVRLSARAERVKNHGVSRSCDRVESAHWAREAVGRLLTVR